MTALISACICLLWPQEPLQPASLTIDSVENVAILVDQLSKSTGQKLNVDPEIGRINIYVRGNQVSADELETRIADLTKATWKQTGTSLHLTRTRAQEKEIRDGVVAQLAPIYKKALWETRSGMPDGDAVQAGQIYARDLRSKLAAPAHQTYDGPTFGLLVDILRRIGPSRLASIPTFQITLFSDHPAAPEASMPDMSDLISRYQDICRSFAKNVSEDSMQGILDPYSFDHYVAAMHHADSLGRVLLSFFSSFNRAFALLTLYDSKSNILTEWIWAIPNIASPATTKGDDSSVRMEWSEPTVDFIEKLTRKDPAVLKAPLFQSVFTEPLRLQAVPGLQQLAHGSTCNILCPLPDEVVPQLFTERPKTVGNYRRAMAKGGVSIETRDQWISGKLSPLSFNPARFVDRKPLHEWEDRSLSRSVEWLRNTTTFYAQAGDAASNGLFTWIKLRFWPLLKIVDPIQELPRDALFALGTLSNSEWDELNRGHSVSAVGSGDRGKRIEQWSWLSARELQREVNSTGPDVELIGSYAFPAGPPESSTLSMTQKSEPIIQLSDSKDEYWMNLGQVANWICDQTSPGLRDEDAILATVKSRFNVAYRPSFTLEVKLSPTLLMRSSQSEAEFQVIGKSVTISDFPKQVIVDLKKEIHDFLGAQATQKFAPPPH